MTMSAPARDSRSSLEHQSLATSTQQMRARVGASIAAVLILAVLLSAPSIIRDRRWALLCASLLIGGFASGLILLFRRRRSPTLPAVLLVTILFIFIVSFGSVQGGIFVSASVWTGFLALLAVYLLGTRQGSIFAILAMLQIGWSFALHHSGMSLPGGHLSPPDSWLGVASAALGVGMIGALGYLYESAQKRTLGELSDALVASEQNERQLDLLFESTSAAVCSLDRDMNLITCNRAFARMANSPGGLPPQRGESLQGILLAEQYERWKLHIDRLLGTDGQTGESGRMLADTGPIAFEEPPPGQDAPYRETTMHAMLGSDRIVGVTVFSRDITERKRAEAEMQRLQENLVRVSREAGMAAVASEVLHNAGNVLNSTGVSVAMLDQHVKDLRVGHLSRAVALLEEHAGHLDAFLRDDPRGKPLFAFLRGLTAHVEQHQQQVGAEVSALQASIEHLTRIIQAQRSHARSVGVLEVVSVDELVDAALELQAPSWSELGITLERPLAALPQLRIDKHKVIEILVNLISNARQSLRESGRADKRVCIRTESAGTRGGVERVRIHVEDNGVGIDPANRAKLFRLGFSTKPEGAGIGLHSSAITAQQLSGSLSFHSDGPGQGAVFTLELPVTPVKPAAPPAPTPPSPASPAPDDANQPGSPGAEVRA
jgi:signal transduction histidine kinase/PAS domain-containing protein